MSQKQLADTVGFRFQQVHKFESGANRLNASRLFQLSVALGVPVSYFYDGLEKNRAHTEAEDLRLQRKPLELIRRYYRLSERPRQRLLEIAKTLEDE